MTYEESWNEVAKCVEQGDVEKMFEALSVYFKIDAENQTHETVKFILNGLSETMREAAFAYYASTK